MLKVWLILGLIFDVSLLLSEWFPLLGIPAIIVGLLAIAEEGLIMGLLFLGVAAGFWMIPLAIFA